MGAALAVVVAVPDDVPAPLAMEEAALTMAAAVAGDTVVLPTVIGDTGAVVAVGLAAVATGGHWVVVALGAAGATGDGAAGVDVLALGAAGVGLGVVAAAAVPDCKVPPATQAAKLA